MSIFSKPLAYAKSHPVPVAIGAVVVVGGIYLLTRGGGSAQGQVAQANATATSAYYSAESAQGVAGDQLQATQIAANAAVAQAQIAAGMSTTNTANTNATTLAVTQANDATATALAPYQVQGQLVTTLGQVASLPGTTTTTTTNSGNSGFFGIGASKSSNTTTTTAPNPAALSAAAELQALEQQFNPMNG
jgi:hypothetical protein